MRLRDKAQSTLEYAIIIAVVVGALLAMQIYMKRGVQGKLRDSSDQVGEQFEAQKTRVISSKTRIGTTVQEVRDGVTSTVIDKNNPEVQTESGFENVSAQ